MAIDADTITFVHNLFDALGRISTRKMMGGLTIYANDQIFALVARDGRLFLKAKGDFAAALAAAGAVAFQYDRNGTLASMGYWTLPDAALNDPELACDWGRRALAAT